MSKPSSAKRRFTWTVLVLLALGGLGWWGIHVARDNAKTHIAGLGLVLETESPWHALAVLLPGESPPWAAPQDQTLSVFFERVKNPGALRECVARLGAARFVAFVGGPASTSGDVGAILDVAKPTTVKFTGQTLDKAAIEAVVRQDSVGMIVVESCVVEPGAFAPLADDERLTNIELTGTTVTGDALNDLMRARELHELTLRQCTIETSPDWQPASSESIDALLLTAGTQPPAKLGEWLAGMPKLEVLNVALESGEQAPPATFASLPKLKQLTLTHSKIDAAWLEQLPTLPALEQISLQDLPITYGALNAVVEKCPALKTGATDEGRFTKAQIAEFKEKHPNIEMTFWPLQWFGLPEDKPTIKPVEADDSADAEATATEPPEVN